MVKHWGHAAISTLVVIKCLKKTDVSHYVMYDDGAYWRLGATIILLHVNYWRQDAVNLCGRFPHYLITYGTDSEPSFNTIIQRTYFHVRLRECVWCRGAKSNKNDSRSHPFTRKFDFFTHSPEKSYFVPARSLTTLQK